MSVRLNAVFDTSMHPHAISQVITKASLEPIVAAGVYRDSMLFQSTMLAVDVSRHLIKADHR